MQIKWRVNVFGSTLCDLRISLNMSQKDLSKITGLDRSFISLLEQGSRTPTLATIVKLSKAFNMKPSQFLSIFENRYFELTKDDTYKELLSLRVTGYYDPKELRQKLINKRRKLKKYNT